MVVPLLWWLLVSSSTALTWAPSLATVLPEVKLSPGHLPSPRLGSSFSPAQLAAPSCQHHAGYAQFPIPVCLRKKVILATERQQILLYFPSCIARYLAKKAVWQVVSMMQTVHTSILKGSLYGHFFLFSLTTHLLAICWKLLTIKCDTDFSVATDFIYSQAPLS